MAKSSPREPLRFGLLWPFRNPAFARVAWAELYRSQLELAVESEALGFDDAWLTEHHFVDDGYSSSLFPIAAAIAARTRRIRIGTFVLLLPLHNPVRVAEDTATLDLISHGRFDLGVGLGYRPVEFENLGVARTTRGARMEESLEIVQRLLRDETVTLDGAFTTLRGLRIVPPALQRPHPPIWVGGLVPKAIDRAARMGFHFLLGAQPQLVEMYDDALRTYGRNPLDYSVASLRAIYVARSREEAWELAAPALHYMVERYAEWAIEANGSAGAENVSARLPSVDEIVRAQSFNAFGDSALVGTPQDVIEQINDAVSRCRLTHLVGTVALPGLTPDRIRGAMELFAKHVMPYFRSLAGVVKQG